MGHMVTLEGGSKHKAQPKLLVITFKASGYKAKSKLEWCRKKILTFMLYEGFSQRGLFQYQI